MDKIKLVFFSIFILLSVQFVFAQDEAKPVRDFLYSAEYFDYLIECASQEKQSEEQALENEEISLENEEITAFEFDEIID